MSGQQLEVEHDSHSHSYAVRTAATAAGLALHLRGTLARRVTGGCRLTPTKAPVAAGRLWVAQRHSMSADQRSPQCAFGVDFEVESVSRKDELENVQKTYNNHSQRNKCLMERGVFG